MKQAYLDKALAVARTSEHATQVGCILLKKGRIVTEATNSYKTHPVQAHWAQKARRPYGVHLHAEMAALVRCTVEADTLIVARIDKKGVPRISKPCPICRAAIEESTVKTIVYIDRKGEWREERV